MVTLIFEGNRFIIDQKALKFKVPVLQWFLEFETFRACSQWDFFLSCPEWDPLQKFDLMGHLIWKLQQRLRPVLIITIQSTWGLQWATSSWTTVTEAEKKKKISLHGNKLMKSDCNIFCHWREQWLQGNPRLTAAVMKTQRPPADRGVGRSVQTTRRYFLCILNVVWFVSVAFWFDI